jgi:glycosyltransferase involved in cell wall biosynthesis
MRICYVVHSANHFAAPYVEYFAAAGHEIHVISFSHGALAHAIMHYPVARDYDPTGNKLDYVRAIPAVRRLLGRIAPDLVHAHYLTSNGLVAAAAGFHPLVVSARGSDVHQSVDHLLRRTLIRFVMRRADLVNPVSRELAAKIAALGVPEEKILCVTQGIDVGRFALPRRAARGAAVEMICTRKLHAPYQPAVIVEALTRLAAQGLDFRFTFAASGRDEAALRALVAARGLRERVTFLGGYHPDTLPALLAGAHVYVSASRWDGTSPALLEAMAAGALPVVTDCPANREWLSGDGDGFLFATDDPDDLARCLQAAARGDLWDTAAARNRATVQARADRAANLRLLGEHYLRLVGSPGPAGEMRDVALGLPGSGRSAPGPL